MCARQLPVAVIGDAESGGVCRTDWSTFDQCDLKHIVVPKGRVALSAGAVSADVVAHSKLPAVFW